MHQKHGTVSQPHSKKIKKLKNHVKLTYLCVSAEDSAYILLKAFAPERRCLASLRLPQDEFEELSCARGRGGAGPREQPGGPL